MSLLEGIIDSRNNPLAVVEDVAADNNLSFERSGDDEITIVSKGNWTDYQLSFTWMNEIEALHLACAFDFKAGKLRLGDIYKLMALINEQLWLGHFDLWKEDGLLLYRHGLLLAGADTHVGQCEALLKAALEACERYYQSFQFVLWAGKSPEEALAATLLETQGQA